MHSRSCQDQFPWRTRGVLFGLGSLRLRESSEIRKSRAKREEERKKKEKGSDGTSPSILGKSDSLTNIDEGKTVAMIQFHQSLSFRWGKINDSVGELRGIEGKFYHRGLLNRAKK